MVDIVDNTDPAVEAPQLTTLFTFFTFIHLSFTDVISLCNSIQYNISLLQSQSDRYEGDKII